MIFLTIFNKLQVFTAILATTVTLSIGLERPGHECKRQCVRGRPQFKCHFDFFVKEHWRKNQVCEDGNQDCAQNTFNSIIMINGQSPGPTIEICLGDTVEVVLHNRLSSQEVSLHWNGVHQIGSPHMDGVSMISQCPVLPYSSFRYDLKPEANGTYFYHAHSSVQQGDGLFGALIVYDFMENMNLEKTLMISAQYSSPLSWFPHTEEPRPVSLTVNGLMKNNEFKVQSGRQYRFRIINANVFDCPVAISVADHPLEVIALGSNSMKPSPPAKHLILFPGEKLDVILETNQVTEQYLFTLQGLHECRHLIHKATLTYDDADNTMSNDNSLHYLNASEKLQGHECQDLGKDVVCSLDLRSQRNDYNAYDGAISIYYIPFDVNFYSSFSDDMTDYSFNIYGFSFYPSYLTLNKTGQAVAQINRMTFKYPSSPILSQPEAVSEDMICSLENPSKSCEKNLHFCECLQILPVPINNTIEIIFINEGKGGNASHVFHTHGYSVAVISVNHFTKPITKDEIILMDQQGLLTRNLIDPPIMDTFVVPNKGFVIIRFFSNNLGYWLWESRSTGVFPATRGPAMQFLLRVGSRENLPTVPIDFPTCGNHKGPDLIFEDE